MDVILCIAAEDAKVLFPTCLYTAKDFISVELQHGAIDLRIASYYMDLAINFSPISVLQASTSGEANSPTNDRSNTQLFIKHVDLDGHRAFGLPPTEPAYMATWYVDVGAILGECSESFIHDAALAAKAFVFAFSDRENALPLEAPIMVFDATFLQLKTDIIRVGLHVGANAIIASTGPVSVEFNDWADELFSQRVKVEVPDLTLACLDASTLARHRAQRDRKEPART
ncbi:Macrophage colony-stimulating factor 1 receptor, partial [Oleoguttula sp. CCFEE 5521]